MRFSFEITLYIYCLYISKFTSQNLHLKFTSQIYISKGLKKLQAENKIDWRKIDPGSRLLTVGIGFYRKKISKHFYVATKFHEMNSTLVSSPSRTRSRLISNSRLVCNEQEISHEHKWLRDLKDTKETYCSWINWHLVCLQHLCQISICAKLVFVPTWRLASMQR